MRPICVRCRREMAPGVNEFLVKDKAVGNSPSTYRFGDLFECPDCGAQVVVGFGKGLTESEVGGRAKDALEFIR
jgi:hypothetical protein